MELKINIVEAAAELAEGRVRSFFEKQIQGDPDDSTYIAKLEELVYQDDGSEGGGTIYTDAAQEMFNFFYDRIFEKLIDCKVTSIPNLFNSKHIFIEDAIEHLANLKVEDYFRQKLKGQTKEVIAAATWALAELNSMVYTKEAQKVFDEAKVYYEMNLTQFEI